MNTTNCKQLLCVGDSSNPVYVGTYLLGILAWLLLALHLFKHGYSHELLQWLANKDAVVREHEE